MQENLKILIVDDNAMMRIVINGSLVRLFPEPVIYQASKLSEAFDLLENDSFDLLILDINMPGGDSSPDEVRKMLKLQPALKICMFSGNDKESLEQSYLDAGAIGFIQKDNHIIANAERLVKKYFN